MFAVHHPDEEGVFALKRLRNPDRRARFDREIETMREVHRAAPEAVPEIVGEGADSKGRPFFVMPWMPDGSLQGAVDDGRFAQDLPAGLELLAQLAARLAVVHRLNIAHRDLKPANVLLEGSQPVLTDFDLCLVVDEDESRYTGGNEAVGSWLYIAPENEGGINEDVDQRPADFYAFGKVAWALLAGRIPPAREAQLVAGNRLADRFDDSRLATLDLLFEQLLIIDPRARLADWDQVEGELAATHINLTGTQIIPPADDAIGRAGEAARRFASSQQVLVARAEREAEADRGRFRAEIGAAVSRGLREYDEQLAEASAPTGGELTLFASQGGFELGQLNCFDLMLEGAEGSQGINALGARESLQGGSPALVAIGSPDAPERPDVQLYSYVWVEDPQAWLMRIPTLLVGVNDPRITERLLDHWAVLRGPYPLRLGSTLESAEQFGRDLARCGIDLFTEVLQLLTAGVPLQEPGQGLL